MWMGGSKGENRTILKIRPISLDSERTARIFFIGVSSAFAYSVCRRNMLGPRFSFSGRKRVGLLFLCLIISHEGIALGSRIQETVRLQNSIKDEMMDQMQLEELVDADSFQSVVLSTAQAELLQSKIAVLIAKAKPTVTDLSVSLDDNEKLEYENVPAPKILGSAVYGFVDGFFHGALTDGLAYVKKAFTDAACGEGIQHIKRDLKRVGRQGKYFAGNLTNGKISWSALKRSGTGLLFAVKKFLRSGVTFIWKCPGTKMLTIIAGLVMFAVAAWKTIIAVTTAITAGIGTILMMVWKILNVILAAPYLHKRMKDLKQYKVELESGECKEGPKCRLRVVEARFSLIGALTEVLLTSCKGMIVQVGKWASKIAKSLKMKYAASISKDLRKMFFILGKAKRGESVNLVSINKQFYSVPWLYKARKAVGNVEKVAKVVEKSSIATKTASKVGSSAKKIEQHLQTAENVIGAIHKGHRRHKKVMDAIKGSKGYQRQQKAFDALRKTLGHGKKAEAVVDNVDDVGKLAKHARSIKEVGKKTEKVASDVKNVAKNVNSHFDKVKLAHGNMANQLDKHGKVGKFLAKEMRKVEKLGGNVAGVASDVGVHANKVETVAKNVHKSAQAVENVDEAILATAEVAKKTAKVIGTGGQTVVVASHLAGARKWRLGPSMMFVGDDRVCNGEGECPFVSKNFVVAGKDVNDGDICNVLDDCSSDDSEPTTDNDSTEFLELDAAALNLDQMGTWDNVEGECDSMDATEVFRDLSSRCGKYEYIFDCNINENLCKCLQWAGEQGKPVIFTRGSSSISFFKDGDQLHYELICGKGKKNRRRQFKGTGGC